MVAQLHGTMIKMENFQKLHELKKDLIGIDNLVIPGRVSSRCWSNAREQRGHLACSRVAGSSGLLIG